MPVRVAHYMPHYPGRDGSAAFCRGLSRAMNRIAPGSCPVITLRRGEIPAHPEEDLLRYPWDRPRNPFRVPGPLLEDLTANRHQLDGLALHGTYNPPMVTLARHCRKIGMPYVFIPHDPYVPELRNHHRWRKLAFWHVFEKPLIEQARAVQLLDEGHERYLRELGCEVPVFTIPNGCEPEMLREIPGDARVPGAGSDVKILYFGRMDRNHKGLDLLLEGFARAVQMEPAKMAGVTLVMTGNDWTDRGWLEAHAARLGIAGQVTFTGRRDDPAMRIVSEADLVILPSRFDGFGLCVVEAMLAARPVIVSSGAGVVSHVGKAGGGWITEPSAEAIAAALQTALGRRAEWEALGRRNRDHVASHLTWERVAERTLEAYERHLR